jgi:hypothetical protein
LRNLSYGGCYRS